MLAMFMAQRVILMKRDFLDVPEVLKPDTYQILKESGMEYLAGDYEPMV